MELSRRDAVRLFALLAAAPALAACGAGPDGDGPGGGGAPIGDGTDAGLRLVSADVDRVRADPAAAATGAAAVDGLAAGLLSHSERGNLVISPYSVVVALGMTLNGARGATADEMTAVLGGAGVEALNQGLNALTRHVDSLAGEVEVPGEEPGEVLINTANTVFGQGTTTWEQPFLEALAAHYGAGLQAVDFAGATEAARTAINGWVAEQTADRIPELVPPDVLSALTRMVLVNAIHFKAPWARQFESATTEDGDFTTGAGTRVRVPLMRSSDLADAVGEIDGAIVARLPYAGGGLAMTVVLPSASGGLDADALWERMAEDGVADLLGAVEPGAAELTMPRWEMRTQVALNETLAALGMPGAFDDERADFSGMTREERLFISAVLHEGWIAVDETGTEAAAATAVAITTQSLRPIGVPVVLDRPFAWCIHDLAHGTPLFVGWVDDPS